MSQATKQNSIDYSRVEKAIEFISANASQQPSLDDIASHLHLSPFHFQRLFSQWAGITPKQFLQVLTVEHAKQLLTENQPLLKASATVGLSSSSRLHDHFVNIEAMTPGEFKQMGKGKEISYGHATTAFGSVFVATTDRGICKLAFAGVTGANEEIETLKTEWPDAFFTNRDEEIGPLIEQLFDRNKNSPQKVSLCVSGTNFQINVWKSLLRIPEGQLASYSDIANAIGKPKSVRAVGTAIGANPVGYLIPCHRVIRQSGALGGYRWGLTRKQALLAWETTKTLRA